MSLGSPSLPFLLFRNNNKSYHKDIEKIAVEIYIKHIVQYLEYSKCVSLYWCECDHLDFA